jgi:hypothetical protein
MPHEGRLHRVQVAGLAQPLDRQDLGALVHNGERQAGIDPPPIHQHGTGTALAVIAAFLATG